MTPTSSRSINDIFNFRKRRSLLPTGYLPSFVDSLVEKELLDLENYFTGINSSANRRLAVPSPSGRGLG